MTCHVCGLPMVSNAWRGPVPEGTKRRGNAVLCMADYHHLWRRGELQEWMAEHEAVEARQVEAARGELSRYLAARGRRSGVAA